MRGGGEAPLHAQPLVRDTKLDFPVEGKTIVLVGAFGASTVVGAFVFGWPSIIAVIINYVKRGDARGTWLESHFTWQVRTFWYAMLWAAVVFLVGLPLTLLIVGFAIWAVGLFALGIWAIYRIALGWTRLNARRPVG